MGKMTILIKTYLVRLFRFVTRKKINDNLWVFSSSYNTEYNYNSKYLFENVVDNYNNIEVLYVVNDSSKREYYKEKYSLINTVDTRKFKGINKVLESGVWFTSSGLPLYGHYLSKNRLIINLWHGIPLKKIGLLSNETSFLTKIYLKMFLSKNYTHLLTTSSKLSETMSRSFNVSEDIVKVWGQPRNDMLYKENNPYVILNELIDNLPDFKNVILYAPTFREGIGTTFFPFDDMNSTELNEYLDSKKILLLIRSHQSEESNAKPFISDRIRLFNQDKVLDIMDCLNIFNLLVTDYSSIYIDYLLLNRPIIFLPYDKNEYLKNRGLNFEYDRVTPGPKPLSLKDFILEIDRLIIDNNYYMNERTLVNDMFNEIKGPVSKSIINNILEELKYNNC